MKNITLSADERLIEEARKRARSQNSTLNEQFRLWLRDYVGQEDRGARARRAIEETRKIFRTHGPYTREEMNARGSYTREEHNAMTSSTRISSSMPTTTKTNDMMWQWLSSKTR